ncbi:sodium-driven chloride bicarbonate exchanger [Grus japonensis]|uniref:Sodium-driven chloride bicarbonate exchanger n=1 Tax=Grus japonensis TaxID=30415 RepID=A0ABC9X2Q8_GRUJA
MEESLLLLNDQHVDMRNVKNFKKTDTPSQRVQFILGTEDDDEEHIPHDLFTELDEICWREGEDAEWRETARWLKFEEDVEDGGERWSKPYVATLSLHSLFELRSCILNGTVLLDMRANSIEEIADMILDQQVGSGQLSEDVRHRVHEALLKQHHHQNQKKLSNRIPIVRSFADIGKKQSEPHSMDKNGQIVSPQSAPACIENKNDVSRENSTVDFSKVDLHFMKKIPPGAEASNILVGELEFLDRAVVAFVRLSPAVLLTGLAEVPIPTRFLFILLGPLGKGQQYHEIGRSIATLMTDEVFHDVAYKAKDRNDLVSGIDEFLDQVTVLPPGEWDPTIRIEPPKNVPSQSAIESLFGASMTGIAYSLFGGQPLTILGSTGPVLVFEKILFKFCKEYGLSYLSLRASIGLWTAILCIILVATDASSLVCYITRFTEEAFASLICIIFIYEALEKLFHLSETYPINMHNDLDLLTKYSCNCVEPEHPSNKTLQYWQDYNISASDVPWGNLTVSVRSVVSDFAVFLTILSMVLIDYAIGIPSPKLQVPNAFKKGCGYHLDLLMVAVMLGVCSIMGLPWFVAATVLSISHVNSLKLESECSAPGEQPKFLGIREQRVTGLMIFILMGSSVFLTSILKFIPMPVLYGVFLYMGASSLKGIQVLALVFVRKLMDFFFTKRELSWLDDLMPESKKKKLEDAEKEEEQSMLAMEEEGTVQLPLEGHYSAEIRKEKKADSGKGVDRETCL